MDTVVGHMIDVVYTDCVYTAHSTVCINCHAVATESHGLDTVTVYNFECSLWIWTVCKWTLTCKFTSFVLVCQ